MTSINFSDFTFPLDVDSSFTFLLFIVGLLLVLWIAVIALLKLRRRPMDETARALWAFLIVYAPLIGALVFFIVRPGNIPDEVRRHA